MPPSYEFYLSTTFAPLLKWQEESDSRWLVWIAWLSQCRLEIYKMLQGAHHGCPPAGEPLALVAKETFQEGSGQLGWVGVGRGLHWVCACSICGLGLV